MEAMDETEATNDNEAMEQPVKTHTPTHKSMRTRKAPTNYVPSFSGKKYESTNVNIQTDDSGHDLLIFHVMTQLSMKASLKEFGK